MLIFLEIKTVVSYLQDKYAKKENENKQKCLGPSRGLSPRLRQNETATDTLRNGATPNGTGHLAV